MLVAKVSTIFLILEVLNTATSKHKKNSTSELPVKYVIIDMKLRVDDCNIHHKMNIQSIDQYCIAMATDYMDNHIIYWVYSFLFISNMSRIE